ncbi:uncharacterized protein BP01DRAFT_359010 [Aspergillus saccharolyticus JOP 1030-1]|uniref:Uncharacterized protein n=1 Tax=Aspergillus saccharolyticus JOP 1030-1 TaxID=1450539 RepID=A0A318Z9F3_9EURO|nr:hypothetical protein BP01DRAFT_359010 [Aspergillus saccharolyticus JOP 1030-1]PYH43047.1 hypothetical protein BP01DRAFT_359010 [Aspergillus saccharolyticus JOP 1030-1]
MVKDLTFDVRYDNELAHDYYGDGEKLTKMLNKVYEAKHLQFPDNFDSTLTSPPIHFMSVSAPDDVEIDDLREINVPPGLNIDILDFAG